MPRRKPSLIRILLEALTSVFVEDAEDSYYEEFLKSQTANREAIDKAWNSFLRSRPKGDYLGHKRKS